MSEPFIGQISIFGGNFAPRDWAFCDGTMLNISEQTALYSIIGITYGGDGRTTFALPNLQGRAPMSSGSQPGLTPKYLGQAGGLTDASISLDQMPSHSHSLKATASASRSMKSDPTGNIWGGKEIYGDGSAATGMSTNMLSTAGGSQNHNNMQPSLALNFIIAIEGLYPPRS